MLLEQEAKAKVMLSNESKEKRTTKEMPHFPAKHQTYQRFETSRRKS